MDFQAGQSDCARQFRPRGNGLTRVVFNSNPVEFRAESVVLDVDDDLQEIANDYVWIFAGGTPPTGLLKKISVAFGMLDMTLEAGKEARKARSDKQMDSLRLSSFSTTE